LNQGPFPPRALPRLVGHTDLSAIPFGPAPSSRTAGSRVPLSTERDFPCCHGTPLASMPSSMPRWTWSVLGSLASCPVSAFPTSKLGRRPHHMVSGPARCSFALRPACSRTRVLPGLYTEGFECFITSTLASVATGWSDSCRVGLTDSPTGVPRLSTAHFNELLAELSEESVSEGRNEQYRHQPPHPGNATRTHFPLCPELIFHEFVIVEIVIRQTEALGVGFLRPAALFIGPAFRTGTGSAGNFCTTVGANFGRRFQIANAELRMANQADTRVVQSGIRHLAPAIRPVLQPIPAYSSSVLRSRPMRM